MTKVTKITAKQKIQRQIQMLDVVQVTIEQKMFNLLKYWLQDRNFKKVNDHINGTWFYVVGIGLRNVWSRFSQHYFALRLLSTRYQFFNFQTGKWPCRLESFKYEF
ncbi:Hypothetical_protein [Hexamita inflata]|uniref:Hypothetical_protein n=1 Tax=Hexamita inflata TaxID=28002 RepID=A0AA86PWF6_9EUKA|nr:Hypothetical protein HINF_LOCUS29947 [Hexamita inflata]